MDFNNQSVVHYKAIIKEKEKPAIISRIWNINNEIYLSTNTGFTKLTANNNLFNIEPIRFKEKEKNELRTFVYSLCESNNKSIYAATNKGIFVMESGKGDFDPLLDINTLVKTDANSAIDCQTILFKNN